MFMYAQGKCASNTGLGRREEQLPFPGRLVVERLLSRNLYPSIPTLTLLSTLAVASGEPRDDLICCPLGFSCI